MKFKSYVTQSTVEIDKLNYGDTFIDPKNFDEEDVFMIINPEGYDSHVEFDDNDVSEIAVVNLRTGELWSYTRNEDVIPVETEEIKYKIKC